MEIFTGEKPRDVNFSKARENSGQENHSPRRRFGHKHHAIDDFSEYR
jgi:hypothetical protein